MKFHNIILSILLLLQSPNYYASGGIKKQNKLKENNLCGYFIYVSHKNSYGYDKYEGSNYGAKQGFYFSKDFPYHFHSRHIYDGEIVTAWAAYGSPKYTNSIDEYIKKAGYDHKFALSSRGHAIAFALNNTTQSLDTTVVTVFKGCIPAISAGKGEDKLYISFPGGKLEVVNTIKY